CRSHVQTYKDMIIETQGVWALGSVKRLETISIVIAAILIKLKSTHTHTHTHTYTHTHTHCGAPSCVWVPLGLNTGEFPYQAYTRQTLGPQWEVFWGL